jgi:AcrR family transcriptional regulator
VADQGDAAAPPPSSPRTRGERTRMRLLEIAIRRFADGGFRDTSVSSIAREANVTPAAVYAYYPDKEGLFVAAFDHDATALLDQVLPAVFDLSAAVSGKDALDERIGLLPRVYQALPKHPLARRVLQGHEPDMVPRLFDLPSARSLTADLESMIQLGQSADMIRSDIDPHAVAVGLQTVLLAMLIAAVQANVTQDLTRRDGVVALISAALRQPPSGSS